MKLSCPQSFIVLLRDVMAHPASDVIESMTASAAGLVLPRTDEVCGVESLVTSELEIR